MITYSCPRCKAVLKAEDSEGGSKKHCTGCGQRVQIPPLADGFDQTVAGELLLPPMAPRIDPSQPSWPQQGSGQPSGFAIASLILGIVSILVACVPILGALSAITGIVLGSISISNHRDSAKGMEIAGVICAIVGLVLSVGVFVVMLASADAY